MKSESLPACAKERNRWKKRKKASANMLILHCSQPEKRDGICTRRYCQSTYTHRDKENVARPNSRKASRLAMSIISFRGCRDVAMKCTLAKVGMLLAEQPRAVSDNCQGNKMNLILLAILVSFKHVCSLLWSVIDLRSHGLAKFRAPAVRTRQTSHPVKGAYRACIIRRLRFYVLPPIKREVAVLRPGS